MSNKEEVIERYLRDSEQKAESLWRKGYNEGHKDGCSLARAMGLADAWETVQKMADMPYEDFCEVFEGFESLADVVRFKDVQTVMAMLKDYEEGCDARLQVGDEVIDPNDIKAVVTNTDTAYHLYYPHNGKTWKAPKTTKLTKTGKILAFEFEEFFR